MHSPHRGGKRLRIRTSIFGIVACIALVGSAIPVMAAPSGRATLTGNVPPWAKSANFKAAANPSDSIGFRVYLGWSNPSAVESLAKAVSDPRSASYGHYLTPQQVKGAYGLTNTPYDGSGQTVAIIDAYAAPTIVQDVNQWSTNRGLPTMKPGQFSQLVAPGTYNHPERGLRQDPQGWYGEETLDVEAVHGMAPGANIVYVGSPNNFQDLDAALNHVVDRHLAQIVTNSYGFRTELLPFGFIKPYEDTILQGAIEGITINFSSGDDNGESLVVGYKTVGWPASS